MKIVTLTSTTICAVAMLISSVSTFADGGRQVGPPNSVGGGNGGSGKTNRTGIRAPWSDPSEPDGQGGGQTGQGGGQRGQGGGQTGQGGGQRGWKEILNLRDDQCKPFHAIMKRFHERLKQIDSNRAMGPGQKQRAREQARETRNQKLRGILSPRQFQKFIEHIRNNARPGSGPGSANSGEDGDSSITRQQRAAMARLMHWFSTQVRLILQNSSLSGPEKNKRIAKLKNTYRQKRSQILSPEQVVSWVAIDGISIDGSGDVGGGGDDLTGGPGPGSDPTQDPGSGGDRKPEVVPNTG